MSFFSEIQEKACADYYRPGTVGTPAPPAAKQTEPVRAAEPASPVREEASAPKPLPQTQVLLAPAKAEAPESIAANMTASPAPAASVEPIPQAACEEAVPVSTVPDSGATLPVSSAMPAQSDSKPSAESPAPASAADSAHVPPPPEIKLSASGNARTADDEAGRKSHEEAEAKRRAEWDAKQAAKQAAQKEQRERLAAMNDEDVAAEAVKRVGVDTEKLTRRNMKEAVCEHIQELCRKDSAFARRAMSPEKSIIHCFQYINRKAREYAEQEMQDNGIERRGIYGCDVPDGLCYQWAVDYFNDPDAAEDKQNEEKFLPKPYTGSAGKTSVAKMDKKKTEPKKKPETKKEQNAGDGAAYQQLTLGV